MGELEICLPDWALESAGIAKNAKLECNPDEESGEITLREASYRHNLLDVPYPILQYFLEVGCDLYALNEMLVAESQPAMDLSRDKMQKKWNGHGWKWARQSRPTEREQADMGTELLCSGRQNRRIDLMITRNSKDHGGHFSRHMTNDRHVF